MSQQPPSEEEQRERSPEIDPGDPYVPNGDSGPQETPMEYPEREEPGYQAPGSEPPGYDRA
jgi:hypothetical protein